MLATTPEGSRKFLAQSLARSSYEKNWGQRRNLMISIHKNSKSLRRAGAGFRLFELSKRAQDRTGPCFPHRARLGPPRARPEPPRTAQGLPRAAQGAPRARPERPRPRPGLAQSRPGRCTSPHVRAQSRSEPARGRLCALRASSRPPVRSKSMLQCALARLRLCVRICSSKKLFDKAVSGSTETSFSYTLHSLTRFSFPP